MLKGIGVSKGYGIGRVTVYREPDLSFEKKSDCSPEREKARFEAARQTFLTRQSALHERVLQSAGESAAEIIQGHIQMIQDPYLLSEVDRLLQEGHCAEEAFSSVCDSFIALFSSVDDEMTRARAADVRDIRAEMLALLLGREIVNLSDLAPDTVLVARELTPSLTACIDPKNVVAFVTEQGSKTSHSAILARAMEIPAVLSLPQASELLQNGQEVIVDGIRGEVFPSPSNEQKAQYLRRRLDFQREKAATERYRGRPTETADGVRVELFGNIGTPEDAARVAEADGEGIGLFRTEFLFLDRTVAPDENEQFEAYKKALLIQKDRPVIIRTLDIGGDKEIPYLGMEKEENPFLGFRAVRYCLQNPEFFKIQLRALLRAAVYGDLRVMIPLVTCVEEVRAVRALWQEAAQELSERGADYRADVPIGVMIETPAAAFTADLLAREADFFSIGTNDLTGYTMAVDRGNARVAPLYSALQPAVLRAIREVIAQAKKAGIPVGMCGESAADPMLIPLLIAFGLDEFSVTPTAILATRREIARWSRAKADELAERVLALSTEKEVAAELEKALG